MRNLLASLVLVGSLLAITPAFAKCELGVQSLNAIQAITAAACEQVACPDVTCPDVACPQAPDCSCAPAPDCVCPVAPDCTCTPGTTELPELTVNSKVVSCGKCTKSKSGALKCRRCVVDFTAE